MLYGIISQVQIRFNTEHEVTWAKRSSSARYTYATPQSFLQNLKHRKNCKQLTKTKIRSKCATLVDRSLSHCDSGVLFGGAVSPASDIHWLGMRDRMSSLAVTTSRCVKRSPKRSKFSTAALMASKLLWWKIMRCKVVPKKRLKAESIPDNKKHCIRISRQIIKRLGYVVRWSPLPSRIELPDDSDSLLASISTLFAITSGSFYAMLYFARWSVVQHRLVILPLSSNFEDLSVMLTNARMKRPWRRSKRRLRLPFDRRADKWIYWHRMMRKQVALLALQFNSRPHWKEAQFDLYLTSWAVK